MGQQLCLCVTSALLGCCCREVEAYVEERVEQVTRREARVLREELRACASCVSCASGSRCL